MGANEFEQEDCCLVVMCFSRWWHVMHEGPMHVAAGWLPRQQTREICSDATNACSTNQTLILEKQINRSVVSVWISSEATKDHLPTSWDIASDSVVTQIDSGWVCLRYVPAPEYLEPTHSSKTFQDILTKPGTRAILDNALQIHMWLGERYIHSNY